MKYRATLTRNRSYSYFILMLFPRPVRVAYLARRAVARLVEGKK
jgi:hypothetical protein